MTEKCYIESVLITYNDKIVPYFNTYFKIGYIKTASRRVIFISHTVFRGLSSWKLDFLVFRAISEKGKIIKRSVVNLVTDANR